MLLNAPDHVLLWSREAGKADRLLRELGFQIRPGKTYPEGIASATVMFADLTYLELLHFVAPGRSNSPQAAAERDFVSAGPGANSVAVQVADIDAASEFLRAVSFDVDDVVPDLVDPDGPDGPAEPKPASWRDFHFRTSPVAGVELFFIQYPPDPPPTPASEAALRSRTAHPNAARSLSAVWLLVDDLATEADTYARMGFTPGDEIAVPWLAARARPMTLGGGAMILVQSPGLPPEFAMAKRPGARVLGISVLVDDVVQAGRIAGIAPAVYTGVLGPTVRADTMAELGLFVELHEAGGN